MWIFHPISGNLVVQTFVLQWGGEVEYFHLFGAKYHRI